MACKADSGSMVSMMTGGSGHGKDRASVEASAKMVYEWLKCGDSPLRDFISAFSDGAIFFTSSCHFKTGAAAVRFRRENDASVAGITEADFVNVAVSRLCDVI